MEYVIPALIIIGSFYLGAFVGEFLIQRSLK